MSESSPDGTSSNALFPRRTLSANDTSGKRRAPLRKSSMSDLTDETCVVNEENLCPDVASLGNYREFVAIAGVSDIPVLYTAESDDCPPLAPCAIARRKKSASKPQAKALVSLASPHRLLIITKEFCDLFGYSADSEICGRALKTLVGPRTDLAALGAGMQSAASMEVACYNLALYNRNGEDVKVEVTFSPYMSDSETLAGCLLDLVPITEIPIA
jgi:hypothetical protein